MLNRPKKGCRTGLLQTDYKTHSCSDSFCTYRSLLAQHASIHHSELALAEGAAVVKVSALEPVRQRCSSSGSSGTQFSRRIADSPGNAITMLVQATLGCTR